MVNRGGVGPGEPAHVLESRPVGNCDELRQVISVFAKGLDTQCFFNQRQDPDLVVVGPVFVGSLRCCATAPHARNGRGWLVRHLIGPIRSRVVLAGVEGIVG
jgi:hypothetical protein